VKIAVSGRPGVGKTTLCMKVYDALKDKISISGFITKEVREKGRRVGFKLVNLKDGGEVWLARVGKGNVTVGKYVVFVNELEKFLEGVDFSCELFIVDEVGPMELKSRKFIEFIERVMQADNLLVTVHYKSRHWIAEKIKKNFKLYILDKSNRDWVAVKIAEELG